MSRLMGVAIPCGVFVSLAAGMMALVNFSTRSLIAQSSISQQSAQNQQIETLETFELEVPSIPFAFLPAQLSNAEGSVAWQKATDPHHGTFDHLLIQVRGLPANQNYSVFLTEKPTPTFGGVAYIADLKTDENGNGTVVYQGEVKDAFIFEWGRPMNPAVYDRVNLDYIVIWAANPTVTDSLFEKQGDNRRPHTPFDADGEAGVVVLTTSSDPNATSPLQ